MKTYKCLKAIKKNMEDHKKANELLFNYPETFEVHNEFHINWEYPNASSLGDLPCKSLLDRVMIDHTNKKIILVDIKTTADVYNFKHSVEEFDYCRQLAYYWLAIHWYFKNELKLDIEEYEHSTYIVAIQNDGATCKVFEIDDETIITNIDKLTHIITQMDWHFSNNLWDYSREYYEGDGAELLLYDNT